MARNKLTDVGKIEETILQSWDRFIEKKRQELNDKYHEAIFGEPEFNPHRREVDPKYKDVYKLPTFWDSHLPPAIALVKQKLAEDDSTK